MNTPVSADPGISTNEAAERISALEAPPDHNPADVNLGTNEPTPAPAVAAPASPPPPIEVPPEPAIAQAWQGIAAKRAELEAAHKAVNWEHLKANNPGEYSALTSRFEKAATQLNQEALALQTHAQRARETAITRHSHLVEEQRHKMLSAIPEWKDTKTFEEETALVRDYLMSIGYAPAEISSVIDHRAVRMARDAAKAIRRGNGEEGISIGAPPRVDPYEHEADKRGYSEGSMHRAALRIARLRKSGGARRI